MQPLHLWHQKIIEKSLDDNDLTFIILWSSWMKNDNRNPFTDEQRLMFLKIFLKKKTRNKVLLLEDNDSETTWVSNLDNLIQETWKEYLEATLRRLLWWKKINTDEIEIWNQDFKHKVEELTFYCWDIENDYAIQTIQQHKSLLEYKTIKYTEINREVLVINHEWEDIFISSTRVREEIKNKNYGLLEKLIDRKILAEIKKI